MVNNFQKSFDALNLCGVQSSITFSFICVNILSFTDTRESKASMSSRKLNWTQCKDLVYLKSRFQSLGVANLMGLDDLATFQRWCLFKESSLTIHVMIHVEYWELLYSSHAFNVCLSITFKWIHYDIVEFTRCSSKWKHNLLIYKMLLDELHKTEYNPLKPYNVCRWNSI